MASKRRASSLKQPDSGEKKPKVEEEEDTWSSTLATLKTAPKEKPPAKIDGQCPLSTAPGAQVYEDYDCTLNQTNISANNNKFYILQLIEHDGAYSVWHHSGRVGSDGRSKLIKWSSLEAAKKDFKDTFWELTKNNWETRKNFIAQPGKYTLIKVERGVFLTRAKDGDCPEALKNMPLGKLSKQQLVNGFYILGELVAALKEQPPQATRLEKLSSRFYSTIPHNFGRARPPIINSPYRLHAKKVMLLELAKIELEQSLQAQKMKEEEEEEKEVAHSLDRVHDPLSCQLSQLNLGEEI